MKSKKMTVGTKTKRVYCILYTEVCPWDKIVIQSTLENCFSTAAFDHKQSCWNFIYVHFCCTYWIN